MNLDQLLHPANLAFQPVDFRCIHGGKTLRDQVHAASFDTGLEQRRAQLPSHITSSPLVACDTGAGCEQTQYAVQEYFFQERRSWSAR